MTGVMHAGGRARSIWEELRRSELGRDIPEDTSPVFEPFSYVPDLEMLVQRSSPTTADSRPSPS